MKRYIYGLILLSFLSFSSCENDENENSECVATTSIMNSSENYERTINDYYNSDGYLYRRETNYINGIEDYETFQYDNNYNLLKYFHSTFGTREYEYNDYGILKIVNKDDNGELEDYFVYEYEGDGIINCERYFGVNSDGEGLDTAYHMFYNKGLLDSLVIKRLNENSNSPKYTKIKKEFKYDENGNLTESLFFDNSFDDEVFRLRARYLYSYNEQGKLTRKELLKQDKNFKSDEYERFFYNEYGNIVLTKKFDGDENLIDFYETKYSGDSEKELIIPEL